MTQCPRLSVVSVLCLPQPCSFLSYCYTSCCSAFLCWCWCAVKKLHTHSLTAHGWQTLMVAVWQVLVDKKPVTT